MGAGRPVSWTDEKKSEAITQIINRICEGESLRSILNYANRDLLPTVAVFLKWVSEDKELEKQYARATEIRADAMFDEILEIADESNADVDISEDGKVRISGEAIQRSRLKVDARKWALSKMAPKKYGDKLDLTSDGDKINNSVTIFQLPDNGRDPDN